MRAIIVSAQRSGGLFLAGCLSNHPDISCPREEPFRGQAIWKQVLKLSNRDLLDFILSQPYYKVNACRLTYDQIFDPEISAFIFENKIGIIHLTREILPTVTSTLLAKQEIREGIPRHWFDDTFQDNEILDVSPEEVIKRIKHLIRQRRIFKERFSGEILSLTYEEITACSDMLPEGVTWRICDFLEIDYHRLIASNRKMHRRSIESYYSRWNEISDVISQAFPDVLVID